MKSISPKLHALLNWIWKHSSLNPNDDFVLHVGLAQKSGLTAVVYLEILWNEHTIAEKLTFLLSRKWQPSENRAQTHAHQVLLNDIFGSEEDYGRELGNLMLSHGEKEWDFSSLTADDLRKADALDAHAILARNQFKHIKSNPPLNLKLAKINPVICLLVYPMCIKVPVRTFQYFLEIHAHFAFNEIRKSGHVKSNDIISYLYELLFIQQKTALALNQYVRAAANVAKHKKADKSAVLLLDEATAIMNADLIFSYLKATIEKTIALIAATHSLKGTENKKSHKDKVSLLRRELPELVKNTPYGKLILEFIGSDQIEDLNNYRTGILHKKGIADLQPHSYAKQNEPCDLPFLKVFGAMHEQHTRNTAVLLCALALLTDELMRMR